MTAAQKQARATYLYNQLHELETSLHITLAQYRGQQRIAACDLDGLDNKARLLTELSARALTYSIAVNAVLRECGR